MVSKENFFSNSVSFPLHNDTMGGSGEQTSNVAMVGKKDGLLVGNVVIGNADGDKEVGTAVCGFDPKTTSIYSTESSKLVQSSTRHNYQSNFASDQEDHILWENFPISITQNISFPPSIQWDYRKEIQREWELPVGMVVAVPW